MIVFLCCFFLLSYVCGVLLFVGVELWGLLFFAVGCIDFLVVYVLFVFIFGRILR